MREEKIFDKSQAKADFYSTNAFAGRAQKQRDIDLRRWLAGGKSGGRAVVAGGWGGPDFGSKGEVCFTFAR